MSVAARRGVVAERFIARCWEKERGWELVGQRFRTRCGELDVVFWDRSQKTLVCVEVKYRRNVRGLVVGELLPPAKHRALIAAAAEFAGRSPLPVVTTVLVLAVVSGVAPELRVELELAVDTG